MVTTVNLRLAKRTVTHKGVIYYSKHMFEIQEKTKRKKRKKGKQK